MPAALGFAVAAGLGVSALLDDMRRAHFGWRQVAAVAAAVGLALPVLALAADTASGRWQLPSADWPTAVSWMSDTPTPGGFRVLWLGAPAAAAGRQQGRCRKGSGQSARARLRTDSQRTRRRRAISGPAREHSADDVLERALLTARAGKSQRLGHLLAPAGIRYVVVLQPDRPGPRSSRRGRPGSRRRVGAPTRPVDLARRHRRDGLRERRVDPEPSSRTTADRCDREGRRSASTAASSDVAAVARGVGGRVGPVCGRPGPERCSGRKPPIPDGTRPPTGINSRARRRSTGRMRSRCLSALPVGAAFPRGRTPRTPRAVEIVAWIVALVVWRRTRAPAQPQSRPWGSGVSAARHCHAPRVGAADPGARDRGGRRRAWRPDVRMLRPAARPVEPVEATQLPEKNALSTAWYCPGMPSRVPADESDADAQQPRFGARLGPRSRCIPTTAGSRCRAC